MSYVDGFVLAVPKKNLAKYRRMASLSAKVWRDHGALAFKECVADHLDTGVGLHFEKLVKPKRGEVVMFSFVVFKSRAHRDRVNAKVIADPRLDKYMRKGAMPFDMKRMAYGGFKAIVDA